MRATQTIDVNNPQGIDLVWQQGDTVDLTFDLIDSLGEDFDLTYYSCDFIARTIFQGSKVIDLSLGNGLNFIDASTIRLYIDDSANSFARGQYDMRMRIRNLSNETTTLFKGRLTIQ